MSMDPEADGPLDGEEEALFSGLPDAQDPPSGLEDQVVARLRERQLLGKAAERRDPRQWWLLAASILVAFAIGFRIGGDRGLPASSYMLLLDRPSGESLSVAQMEARIAEYRAWARSLEERGLLVAAERLLPEADRFGPARPATSPSGFFLIRARDRSEARAAAEACPHLHHGGSVSLQAIDDGRR